MEDSISRPQKRSSHVIAKKILESVHRDGHTQEAEHHEELVGALQIRMVKAGHHMISSSFGPETKNDSFLSRSNSEILALGNNDSIDFGRYLQRDESHRVDFSNDRFPILHATMRTILWIFLGAPANRDHKCIISHQSIFRVVLDILISIAAVLSVIIAPLDLSFDVASKHAWLEGVELVCTCLFITDLVVSFNTTYADSTKDRLVTSHLEIACRYLKGWFLVDLISAIPFDLFVSGSGSQGANVAKLVKLPRLLRAMRLIRMVKQLPFQREAIRPEPNQIPDCDTGLRCCSLSPTSPSATTHVTATTRAGPHLCWMAGSLRDGYSPDAERCDAAVPLDCMHLVDAPSLTGKRHTRQGSGIHEGRASRRG